MSSLHCPKSSRGFLFLHELITETTKNSLQSTSFLYALIDILEEKGLISIDELDEKKKGIAARLVERHAKSGLGLMYQDPEMDKYSFQGESEVDCAKHISKCKAICCKIPFALSRQDVNEGIVRWDFGRPYVIEHGDDGYCEHLDRKTFHCTVHNNRPLPCRGFDCHDSKRWKIWKDEECSQLDNSLDERIRESVSICYSRNRAINK